MIHNLLAGISIAVIRPVLIAVCFFCATLSLHAQKELTYTNGQTVSIKFTETICNYRWTIDNLNIGLPQSGNGDIAPFKIINEGTSPIKATITASTTPVPAKGYGYDQQYRLSVFNLQTYKNEGLIPVPNAVLQTISPDGTIIYLTDRADQHTIYLVSTIDNTVIGTIKTDQLVPASLFGLMLSPDGKRAYSLNVGQNKSVMVFNTETRTEEGRIPLDPALNYNNPVLSPDGSRIYIPSDMQNKVTIVNTATKNVINTLSINRPSNVLFNTDASKVVFTSLAAPDAYIYKPADGSIINIPVGQGVIQSVMAANGNVYLRSGAYIDKIYVIETTTNKQSTIHTGNTPSLLLSPDKKTLYALRATTGDVKVINTTTNKVTDSIIINASRNDYWTSYSFAQVNFDGSRLYVSNKVNEMGKIHIYLSVIDATTKKIIDSVDTPDFTMLRLASTEACSGPPITYQITVEPGPPTITISGQLADLRTEYGTPSASTSFTVSGKKIRAGVKITAPEGLEISTDGVSFTDVITVGGTGDVPLTKVYVRIKATANVEPYTGSITISTAGAKEIKMPLGTIEVTPAPLTVTAGKVDKKYGTILTVANNSKIFIADGLKNGDTIDGADLNIGDGSEAIAPVHGYPGSVTVGTVSGVNFRAGNYKMNTKPGDLEVRPARLTITADNIRRGYLVANPVLTFKYSGFVNGQDATQLTSLPVASTTATITSQVGRYPITVSQASAANYEMNYVQGTLTIETISLIVPNTFTPNGDGINDTWTIRYIEQYPQCTVMVINRGGGQVFYSAGYTTPWNGQSANGIIPAGTYYYVVDPRNGQKPISGSITVIK